MACPLPWHLSALWTTDPFGSGGTNVYNSIGWLLHQHVKQRMELSRMHEADYCRHEVVARACTVCSIVGQLQGTG